MASNTMITSAGLGAERTQLRSLGCRPCAAELSCHRGGDHRGRCVHDVESERTSHLPKERLVSAHQRLSTLSQWTGLDSIQHVYKHPSLKKKKKFNIKTSYHC